jgi:methyl-accepting chemotaxis protein
MAADLDKLGMDSSAAETLSQVIADYAKKFSQLVALQQQIGLTPTDGLYGQLRQSVHNVEDTLKRFEQDTLLKHMLMLRRHEKDFMLRLDMKYIGRFKDQISSFKLALADSFCPSQRKPS